jgi:hypothetical protein
MSIVLLMASVIVMGIEQQSAISVTVSAPADMDCDVEFWPLKAPISAIYPRREWKDGKWIFCVKITSLQHEEWMCLVAAKGKCGIVKFIPAKGSQLNIEIYDIPAPILLPVDGGLEWNLQIPEDLNGFVKRVALFADGSVYLPNMKLSETPDCAFAKIYFDDGGEHWVLSKAL